MTWWCAISPNTAAPSSRSKISVCWLLPASVCRSASSATSAIQDGASEIYREGNQRYVAIKYGVRGRDLGSTVEEAIGSVTKDVKLPPGYRLEWAGEYESQKRSQKRLEIIIPLTLLVIFLILYTMFSSVKWASLILITVAMAPIGGILALYLTGTNFSVSSGVGFLALFGVSVQTGVIMLEYINQLRARGFSIMDAVQEGAVLRFRPILMTMLVASLGLVPAATSHGIGSDSQRPFAIVIVGGLMAVLVMSIFLLPALYIWFASPGDVFPETDEHQKETSSSSCSNFTESFFPSIFPIRCRGAAAYVAGAGRPLRRGVNPVARG